ncbi:MAG: hypothetical protein HQL14_03715 [Candidatus Omnitrophica bacterium]|nr:hypothetical protein [Candidatus Omnitrophota bacterium]
MVTPVPQASAESLLNLPEPGIMVDLSPAYTPVLIKGLKVHPENPFLFDFIIDTGNDISDVTPSLEKESEKLVKYFLTAMTVPEKDLWVNLSPYEKDRMIASNLSQTEMGRDMLAQDYILKQLTASLIYPEKNLGRTFWDEIYSKARQMYGATEIPVNTFNKVWIVADKADVFEGDNVAYVVGAHLKVMLEEDYLALKVKASQGESPANQLGSSIIREIILPAIEKEVNQGKNFAPLRQMFYSMILASWYKMALKDAILTQVYGDQSKVRVGINQDDPKANEEIFNRYLRAYKKGVFNYIKEDIDKISGETIPRKYFSGGEAIWQNIRPRVVHAADTAMSGLRDHAVIATVDTFPRDASMKARKHQNYLKTVVWQSKTENDQGIPEVRYTRVSTLTVGPEEEEVFLKGILKNKDIVLLTKETVRAAQDGNTKITLTSDRGIIPKKYLGQEVVLSGNVAEVLPDFEGSAEDLPRKLREAPEVAIRVNGVFRVRVHDREKDRYLYFLVFNRKALDQGKFRLVSLGGGIRWKKGGLEYYKKNVDGQMDTIEGEDPQDVRVNIQGKNLDKFFKKLNAGAFVEDNVDHELIDELNGENGLFPEGIPNQWLSAKDEAMLNGSPKGIDKVHDLITEKQITRKYAQQYIESPDIAVSASLDGPRAAKLVDAVNEFRSNGELISLVFKGRVINISSTLLLISLRVAPNSIVRVRIGGVGEFESQQIIKKVTKVLTDPAMMGTQNSQENPGGIDFNSEKMQMDIQKERSGVQIHPDRTVFDRIKAEGFEGLEFKIESIVPMTNLPLLLGLKPHPQEGQLAGV